MRFKHETHKPGDTRTITFFAWLPITLHASYVPEVIETRWLETVTVLQEWLFRDGFEWVNQRFVDESQ